MAYRDEQTKYIKKQVYSDFYYEDLNEENAYLKKYNTLKQVTHKIGFW